jgi:hypothetical protein
MNKIISLKIKDQIEEMEYDEFIRWACLIEAVDIVSERAKAISINLLNTNDWIKPIAFQKYIEERFPSLHYNTLQELKHNNI